MWIKRQRSYTQMAKKIGFQSMVYSKCMQDTESLELMESMNSKASSPEGRPMVLRLGVSSGKKSTPSITVYKKGSTENYEI